MAQIAQWNERFGLLIGKADPTGVGAKVSSQVASDILLFVWFFAWPWDFGDSLASWLAYGAGICF